MSYFSSLAAAPPPLHAFDAFKKTSPVYKTRTTLGGLLTLIISLIVTILVYTELAQYTFGEPHYSFQVDQAISTELQLNFDATVAMSCHCKYPPSSSSALIAPQFSPSTSGTQ